MKTANTILIKRGLVKLVKQPSAPVMGFGMSLFFLLVYNAGIGGVGNLEAFGTGGYLSFVFPIAIISLAMGSSAGAGQTLNTDMQSGYFRRLYLSPAPRWVLVLSPMLADTLSSLVFTVLLIIIAAIFGVSFQFGILSVLGILVLSLLWSLTLCGFSAGYYAANRPTSKCSHCYQRCFPTSVFEHHLFAAPAYYIKMAACGVVG